MHFRAKCCEIPLAFMGVSQEGHKYRLILLSETIFLLIDTPCLDCKCNQVSVSLNDALQFSTGLFRAFPMICDLEL